MISNAEIVNISILVPHPDAKTERLETGAKTHVERQWTLNSNAREEQIVRKKRC
jgi:hypothetical protein